MNKLKRPLTLSFLTPRGRITEEDVLEALMPHVSAQSITSIQVAQTESWVTLKDEASRSQLVSTDIRIKGKTVRVRDPGRNVTNATIKDAPIELHNDVQPPCPLIDRLFLEARGWGK